MIAAHKIDELKIQPGVYDISNEDYHNGPGISRTGILTFRKSPFHYWNKYLSPNRIPEKSTKALEFGSAFHPYILEPDLFKKDFCYEEVAVDGRTKEGKLYRKEFMLRNSDKTILTQEDYIQLYGMAKSLNNDPVAVGLLKNAQYEKSIYWNDPETKVLSKCRPDILHSNMICDLKSAVDASPYQFQRAIFNYGYHIQAAMTQDALLYATNKVITDFIFIVIEKPPPYAVAVYTLDEEAIDLGRRIYKSVLVDYKKCIETNKWDSYQIKQISLPAFAYYV